MNYKKYIGPVLSVVGVFLIGYAIYGMQRISHAKGEIGVVSNRISNSSFGKMLSEQMYGALNRHDTQVTFLLVIGIILVIIGGAVAYRYRKHFR